LLLALLVRLPRISESLWYDEAFSVQLVTLPFEDFGPALLADVHPPAYYGILGTALALFGNSPVVARIPSLLFGLVAVALGYRIALRLFGRQDVALVAMLILAVSPAAAYYSVEARSYAMLTCLVFGMVLCLLERRALSLGVLMAMTCWTHNFGYFYVAVTGLIAVLHLLRVFPQSNAPVVGPTPSFRRRIAGLSLGAGGALAWLPFMLNEAGTVSDGYWMYFSPFAFFQPFISMTVGVLPTWLVLPVLIPMVCLLVISVPRAYRGLRQSGSRWIYAVIFGVPALAMAVSFVWHPVFLARGILPSMQLFLILVSALTIGAVQSGLVKRVLLMIFAFALVSFYTYQPRPPYQALLQQYCGQYGAPLYHTSVTTAFVASNVYRTDLPQLNWANARDQGDTFDPTANSIYGFRTGELEQLARYGSVCLMQMLTPLSKTDELAYIDHLLTTYPHQTDVVVIDQFFELHFHRFELQS
jgi:uncharacterized membrane protein